MNGRMKSTGAMALPMSQRDIADYLGLTFETLSRARFLHFVGRVT
jgi:CRP/FNR family nitrogen fixation transcriptional regulator